MQRVVRNLFESAGWTVDTAEDGVQGIESFHLNPPDLVVLDLGLPRLDGHGVCRHLSRLRPTCRSSL